MSTQVFPSLSGLAFPVTRAPMFKTRQQESISGKRTWIADWSYPRWKWTLVFNFLRNNGFYQASSDELLALLGFFNNRQGMFDSFLYSDPDDNSVTNQSLGIGDGSTVQFQLARSYGGYTEPVFAPNVVSTVKVNGVTKTVGTDYGIGNWENGVTPNGTLNFTSAPGSGLPITVTMTYYWPVTFSADTAPFVKDMAGLWSLKKLEFESVK